MSGSSSTIAGSLNPPEITELDASEGLPSSILLDARAYFADRKNSTTATLDTGNGRVLQVSICFAAPPALSYVCIHRPGHSQADLSDEPRVLRSEKQFLLLRLSLWGARFEETVVEYYMYQAIHGGKPKLFQIPDLGPRLRHFFSLDNFGIHCCDDDDGEFILAGLTYFRGYQLRSYSSASKAWTSRPAHLEVEERLTSERMPVATHKVILLGGSLLGFVDLWKGILVCDVLCPDPRLVVGFIPLPLTGSTDDNICPWVTRDVACSDGSLKFIEIEHVFLEPPPAVVATPPDVMYDEDYFFRPVDDQEPEPPKVVDWKATVWNRQLPDNCWRRGFVVHGNDMLVEELLGRSVGVSTARNLLPFFPTLSIRGGGDVVHMISSGRLDTGKTQMISVDMSNSTLKAFVAPCPPLETDDQCAYFPSVLSSYLSSPPAALPQQVTRASNPGIVNQGLPQIVQPRYSNKNIISGNKRQRFFAQETNGVPDGARNGGSNFDLSLVAQASNYQSVVADLRPQIVQSSNAENVTGNKRPRSCNQQVIGAPNSQYEDVGYYPLQQQPLPLQQQPTHLPNWQHHHPNWFTPRPPVNPHPPYPLVNTASSRPMVYPFLQNDSHLLQTPSQVIPHRAYPVVNTASFRPPVNPHPAYPVVNTASFRPTVHPFQQFPQALQLPPTHFSTPSIPPAVGALGSRHMPHGYSHRMNSPANGNL